MPSRATAATSIDGATTMLGTVGVEAPRRRLSPKQAATVDRLLAAALEELREHGFDGFTVRNVAARAELASGTAYSYFTSKEHLVAELFWRRLQQLPPVPGGTDDVMERLTGALTDLALLVADEPELAAACSAALLADDPDVKVLRDHIGNAMRRRMVTALGAEAEPGVVRALELMLSGGLVQAGMGHVGYDQLPDRLVAAAAIVLQGAGLR